jgi:hypothetical protein
MCSCHLFNNHPVGCIAQCFMLLPAACCLGFGCFSLLLLYSLFLQTLSLQYTRVQAVFESYTYANRRDVVVISWVKWRGRSASCFSPESWKKTEINDSLSHKELGVHHGHCPFQNKSTQYIQAIIYTVVLIVFVRVSLLVLASCLERFIFAWLRMNVAQSVLCHLELIWKCLLADITVGLRLFGQYR